MLEGLVPHGPELRRSLESAAYVITLLCEPSGGRKGWENRRTYYFSEDDQKAMKAYVAGIVRSLREQGDDVAIVVIHKVDKLCYCGKIPEPGVEQSFTSQPLE